MKQSGKSYELRNRVSLRSIQAALNPQHQAAYCIGAIHRQLLGACENISLWYLLCRRTR